MTPGPPGGGRGANYRPATIHDVARSAGVSPSTVSRVLNHSLHPVSPGGQRRVLAAARRLGYIPNMLARSLLRHETSAIGVLIPDISNPYYAAILRGIEDAIGPTGRAVILCNTDRQAEKQQAYLMALMERRVDGVIVAGGAFDQADVDLVRGRMPVVAIGRHRVRLPSVRVDNIAAGAMATDHLLSLGHRRIALLAGPSTSLTASDRQRGCRRALRAARVPFDGGLVVEVGFSAEGGSRGARRLIERGRVPTAIVASNDQAAIGAVRALHDLGLRVPDNISVIGFDDAPLAAFTVPALTTVSIPMREMGSEAGRLLLSLLQGRGGSPVVLPCALHVRESTGPPPEGRWARGDEERSARVPISEEGRASQHHERGA